MTNPRLRLAAWIVGPLALFALNIWRDNRALQTRYEWERVEKRTLHKGVFTPGVMEAVRIAEIKSQVDEVVEQKYAEEGQSVKEGQPLARLSRTRTQLEYEQRRNSYLSAIADLRKATRDVNVQKKLLRNLAVSRQQVEDAEQNLVKSKAALDISTQEFQIAQKKLESTLVRSPMNGVVLKDFTKLGALLAIGKEIMTVGDISKFVVRAKVDELDIQQVKKGQTVDITADAFPGQLMKGVVVSIASQAERETFAKIEVLIEITDANRLALKHNLSVRVNIVTEEISDALSVPVKSIVRKDGSTARVTVRSAAGLIRIRKIAIGKTAGDRVEVVSGIDPGDDVGTETLVDKPL